MVFPVSNVLQRSFWELALPEPRKKVSSGNEEVCRSLAMKMCVGNLINRPASAGHPPRPAEDPFFLCFFFFPKEAKYQSRQKLPAPAGSTHSPRPSNEPVAGSLKPVFPSQQGVEMARGWKRETP